MALKYLEDKWDAQKIKDFDEPEKLRYRSNLLGSDLRITNFGGGNTSSKVMQKDPVTDEEVEVLWVKGSGGDLGSIERDGFARLYMSKFRALKDKYRGKEHEDEMVDYYPLCRFGLNDRPASIDTPIHGLVKDKHVDHTHPDWAIALAASANGRSKLQEFNEQYDFNIIWLPWQRPGFHLGRMLEDALEDNPAAEGVIMAGHGLHTWGDEQYECYRRTLEVLDAMGQFIESHVEAKGEDLFGGQKYESLDNREEIATNVMPFIRGRVGQQKQLIGTFVDLPEVLRFINSHDAEKLAWQGTSCPDHFIRTKVRPLFVQWDPESEDLSALKNKIESGIIQYRKDYREYYETNKDPDSAPMRDPNPTVVLIPGVGMFAFGKNKKESRVTGEFYVNAIHVMEGATALEDGNIDDDIDKSRVVNNYVSLSPKEAFNIEYWDLEVAKLKRMPPEQEMARKIAVVVGGGSGIGREFCAKLAENGAHVVAADIDLDAAEETAEHLQEEFGAEISSAVRMDIADRESVRSGLEQVINEFGGIDVLVNTAAIIIYPDKGDSSFQDETWEKALRVNVTSNYILAEEFAEVVTKQDTPASLLLTSSANAVVPKAGSEPYDISKAAVSHMIRELAVRYAPQIRVNGVSPATVVEGSAMFPRDRVIANLKKYNIDFDESADTEILTQRLAQFYAGRTLTQRPIRPMDVVEAGYHLVSPKADRTTGHIIPVDGGLKEAFLR